MSAKKTTKAKEQCDATTCDNTIEDLQNKVQSLVELSNSFSKEIQNIMTTENLSFSYRSSLLGTATKNFVEQVSEIQG